MRRLILAAGVASTALALAACSGTSSGTSSDGAPISGEQTLKFDDKSVWGNNIS